jgi:hypothetical protein
MYVGEKTVCPTNDVGKTIWFLSVSLKILKFVSFGVGSLFSFSFWWDWGLNLGLHASYTNTLPLEPLCQPYIFVLGIFELGPHEFLHRAGFEPQSF